MSRMGRRTACPYCAEELLTTDAFCESCGRSARVNLRLGKAVADGGMRYELAKEIFAHHGAQVRSFAHVRAALEQGDGLIAEAVLRDEAAQLAELLESRAISSSIEVASAVRKSAEPGQRIRPSVAIALTVAAAGVLTVGGVAAVSYGLRSPQPSQSAPDPYPPANPQPATPTPTAKPARPARSASEYSAADIIERIQGVTVLLECHGKRGLGFFVAPTKLLTATRIVCTEHLWGRTSEGRRFRAWLGWFDREKGVAMLRTEFQSEHWLNVRGASPLQLGETAWVGTSTDGTAVAGIEVMVSRLDRRFGERTFIQLDAHLNEHGAGAPLVRRDGTAVGIVAGPMPHATGIGLAWPLTGDEVRSGWNPVPTGRPALPERSYLMLARARGHHVFARVAYRAPGRRPPAFVSFRVHYRGSDACSLNASAQDWHLASLSELVTADSRSALEAQLSTRELLISDFDLDLTACGQSENAISLSISRPGLDAQPRARAGVTVVFP